jgi:hypothetical protein
MKRRTFSAIGPWVLGVGGVAAVTGLATAIATRDDANGVLALDMAFPMVQAADFLGEWLLSNPLAWMTRFGVVVAALAIGCGVLLWWRRRHAAFLDFPPVMVALGFALVGQIFFLHGLIAAGLFVYAEVVLVVVVAHLMGLRGDNELDSGSDSKAPSWGEAGLVLAIGTVAVLFRYYGLNWMFSFFEGELAPYMAGATNLHGMLLANIGWEGTWAPLGLLYYLPIWAMHAIAGSTVLAVRLGSAVISMLTIVVVYVIVRDAIGRTAALWSAALLAVDTLQVGWGRSDIHPHGATAWPGVLLFGATVRALRTGATGWYVAVMLLMGLAWHQYPSGQFVILIPMVAFVVHAAQNRGFFAAAWRKSLYIVAGAGLWAAGYAVATVAAVGKLISPWQYVGLLGPRVLGWSVVSERIQMPLGDFVVRVWTNTWDVVLGIFIEAPRVFHQTNIPDVEGLTQRALPWFVVACAVVGFLLCLLRIREVWSAPLLTLLVAGALPAILSDVAWLKRASVLYLGLVIVAAVPLAIVTDGVSRSVSRRARLIGGVFLAVGFLAWSSIWAHLWFSGRQYPYGVPAETVIVEALEPHLAPNTVLIAALWGDYVDGEILYLLRDVLTERQPLAWYMTAPQLDEWPDLLADPRGVLTRIDPNLWYYSWPGLADDVPGILANDSWTRVVYLIEDRPEAVCDLQWLEALCPDLQLERVFVGVDDEVINDEVLLRYHMWIASCDQHYALIPR